MDDTGAMAECCEYNTHCSRKSRLAKFFILLAFASCWFLWGYWILEFLDMIMRTWRFVGADVEEPVFM